MYIKSGKVKLQNFYWELYKDVDAKVDWGPLQSTCLLTGFFLAVESCDLSQADKSIIRVCSFPKLSDG